MKANSTNPKQMEKMPLMKAKKFQPAKKIAEPKSFSKRDSQMSALKKADMTGIAANGQPKAKRGKTISSLD